MIGNAHTVSIRVYVVEDQNKCSVQRFFLSLTVGITVFFFIFFFRNEVIGLTKLLYVKSFLRSNDLVIPGNILPFCCLAGLY